MTLVKYICETKRGSIYVYAGCHGDKNGKNWTRYDDKALMYNRDFCNEGISNLCREDIATLKELFPERIIEYTAMYEIDKS